MKIRRLAISGFRGFKENCELVFDDRLTLVSAPNSHGKTSISEALEWLLYGVTSKVEGAEAKDEYKGSYRNIHLAKDENPSVTVVVVEGDTETELRAQLTEAGPILFVDGVETPRWPFHYSMSKAPPPFILQHALRNLLLTTPVERFGRFAQLLGLSELGKISKDLVALCTRPPVPESVRKLQADVDALFGRAAAQSQFADVVKELKKGTPGIDKAYDLIRKKCLTRVPSGTDDKSLLPELLRIRDEAVSKVFSERITLEAFVGEDGRHNSDDQRYLAEAISDDLIEKYSNLIKFKAAQYIRDLAELHDIGTRILEKEPTVCPLCARPIDGEVRDHIEAKHRDLSEQRRAFSDLEQQKESVNGALKSLNERLGAYHRRLVERAAPLLNLGGSLDKLEGLLTSKHEVHYEATASAIRYLKGTHDALVEQYAIVTAALESVGNSVEASTEALATIQSASESLVKYLFFAKNHREVIDAHAQAVSEAGKVLQHQLDLVAGTQDVSILIDLLESRDKVRKRARIEQVIASLKVMKQSVDAFVSAALLDAISGRFGDEVMNWYSKIRTSGDPNVHFSGFDMKQTAAGGRVQIKAKSYGKDLVSAVSSLSESKLNALGLCITIAINVQAASPFDFLVIDDPIQSWDEDHETKFIEVLRELVGKGKQVILLSHNGKWMTQVRAQCQDLNGTSYEITSFTEAGPHLKDVPWAQVSQRMATIAGIVGNAEADSIALQQGEEEVRLVVTQLAADLSLKATGQRRNPNRLNAEDVKKIMLGAGMDLEFTNKVVGTFTTVDNSHHSAPGYTAHRDRLRTYHGWLTTLAERVANYSTKSR